MRFVKAVFGVLIIVGLAVLAVNRDYVTSAYAQSDRPTVEVKLRGLDLTIEPTAIAPSPFALASAPDTRGVVVGVAIDRELASARKVSMNGGESSLSGSVVGPEGPVEGAIVRIERHTNEGLAQLDRVTNSRGRWAVRGLEGGRYRVRAWKPGEMTMDHSEVFFITAGGQRSLAFSLHPVDSSHNFRFTTGGEIYQGLRGTVALSVTKRAVDQQGFEVLSGVPGAVVRLEVDPGVTVSPTQTVVDAQGVARFTLKCEETGQFRAVAHYGEQQLHVTLPRCIPQPPQPPPPPPSDSDPNPESGGESDPEAEPAPPSGSESDSATNENQ